MGFEFREGRGEGGGCFYQVSAFFCAGCIRVNAVKRSKKYGEDVDRRPNGVLLLLAFSVGRFDSSTNTNLSGSGQGDFIDGVLVW